ncbi:MAG: SDR family oxidoreductase, partial [bacterium]
PVLTPRLSSLWLGLVTPLFARIGRKLVDSLRNATVVEDETALSFFQCRPRGIEQSIKDALTNEDHTFAETRWTDALSSKGPETTYGGVRLGSRIVASHTISTPLTPAQAFFPIQRIGGDRGWYFGNWLWKVRGFLDLLAGGVGVRRGRRHPSEIALGDTLDFWRVEAFVPNRLLRLFAEMKVPGRAWLQFEVEQEDNETIIRQTAVFDPLGLSGLAYWYALYPLHQLIFSGMLRGIRRAAETDTQNPQQ